MLRWAPRQVWRQSLPPPSVGASACVRLDPRYFCEASRSPLRLECAGERKRSGGSHLGLVCKEQSYARSARFVYRLGPLGGRMSCCVSTDRTASGAACPCAVQCSGMWFMTRECSWSVCLCVLSDVGGHVVSVRYGVCFFQTHTLLATLTLSGTFFRRSCGGRLRRSGEGGLSPLKRPDESLQRK